MALKIESMRPSDWEAVRAIYAEGIPVAAFLVDDIADEYERLKARGVEFRSAPKRHLCLRRRLGRVGLHTGARLQRHRCPHLAGRRRIWRQETR